MKKITAILYCLLITLPMLSFSQAQQTTTSNTSVTAQQQTLLVNKQDKQRIHAFHEQVKTEIETHRKQVHEKKQSIESAKTDFKNEVASFKTQGKLSETQKSDLKSKLASIETQERQLREENKKFIAHLDQERESFFSTIHTKK